MIGRARGGKDVPSCPCISVHFISFSIFFSAVFLFTGPRRVVHPQCGGQRYYLFHHPHNFDTWSSGGCLGDARVLVSALLLLFFIVFFFKLGEVLACGNNETQSYHIEGHFRHV